MGEIWVPELIIILFFLLSAIRPFFKGLWAVDGLVWLPVLGFFLTICLFPAYGFRPEAIPLLIFGVLQNIYNIPLLIESIIPKGEAGGTGSDSVFSGQSLILPTIALVLLVAVAVPLFAFSPEIPLKLQADGVQTRTIRNISAGNDYFLRIYTPHSPIPGSQSPVSGSQSPVSGARPVIFLAPPEAGSVMAVDQVCASLREQGFAVISYSRRGFDFPAVSDRGKYYISPGKISAMWQAFRKGTESETANTQGRYLEAERQKDIEFLLPFICHNQDDTGTVLIPDTAPSGTEPPVFFIGFGAAGSAAAYLFEQPGFSARFKTVKGLAVIESRLWSSFQAGTQTKIEPHWLPQPDIPVLYLVSDRAFGSGTAAQPYRAIHDAFSNTTGSAALAAFEGSGPLAYCDYPLTHPLYSLLFPGSLKNAKKSATPVDDAAGYVGNFFIGLMGQEIMGQPGMPEKREIYSAVLVDRKGLPVF